MKTLQPLLWITFAYLAGALPAARYYPPVSSDEVVRAAMGVECLHGRAARYPLYDDIFARSVYDKRDVLPDTLLAAYLNWLGVWVSLAPRSFYVARLSSVVAGAAALWAFYALGLALGGRRLALAAAALAAVCPFFLTSSCLARPETLLLFTATGTLVLAVTIPETVGLKPFWLGLVAGLQLSLHANAAPQGLALAAFYLAWVEAGRRRGAAWLLAGGGLAGILCALLAVDVPRLALGMKTVHAYLLRPPILDWPWHPLLGLRQLAGILWSGQTFYFNPAGAAGWPLTLRLWWVALGLLLALAGASARRSTAPFRLGPWFLGLAVFCLAESALAKPRDSIYGIGFLPLALPPAAAAIAAARSSVEKLVRGSALILIGAGAIVLSGFIRASLAREKPYDAIVADVRALAPDPRFKVAGPNALWFAWDKDHFRDSGALIVSHWYTGGARDIQAWLAPWRPDILILDAGMRQTLRLKDASVVDLPRAFTCPVRRLGSVETGGPDGRWDAYQIEWPAPGQRIGLTAQST